MNPIVPLLADGNSLFLGMFMTTVALLPRFWIHQRLVLAMMRIMGIIGVVFVLASSTPFPSWIYCGWCILWLINFLLPTSRTKRVLFPTFLMVSISLCFLELPHRFSPVISVRRNQHVYVLGDSISAGLGSAERNWPSVLGDISHLEVTNLSQPGATAASAISQVKGIVKANSLVLIEIGGNDMLGDAPTAQFSKDLDLLLAKIPPTSHAVMFELPLLPLHGGYGQAQRALAKKYHVVLIPKKCLTAVIRINDDTLDGLHLSQKGHNALAASVFSMIRITP